MLREPETIVPNLTLAAETFKETRKYLNLPDQGKVDFLYMASDIVQVMRGVITSHRTTWEEVLGKIEGLPNEGIEGPQMITRLRNWTEAAYPDVAGSTHLFRQSFRSIFRMLGTDTTKRQAMYNQRKVSSSGLGNAYKESNPERVRFNMVANSYMSEPGQSLF